ncbi:MAG: hypothetical protein DME26_03185, partial [Verrucomicrobia bacterium]
AFDFAVSTPPHFVDAKIVNEQFQARLLGEPNQGYVIQASADLGGWTSVTTNVTTAQGFIDFTNAISGDSIYRFYRALSQ